MPLAWPRRLPFNNRVKPGRTLLEMGAGHCSDAELLAIDGVYQTADDMDAGLRGRAVQAWLEGEAMRITALD